MLYFIDQFATILFWVISLFDSVVKKHYVFSDKLSVIDDEDGESSEEDEDEIIMPILIPDVG